MRPARETNLAMVTAARGSRQALAAPAGLLAHEAVNLLCSVPILAPLKLASLERLVRTAVPVDAAAGEAVVAEGDTGDRYYVVRDGELEVRVSGNPLRLLRRGDGFGEIALLREVPRTATVAAVSDTRLFALEWGHFLAIVNGSPSSREVADTTIDMRLGSLRADNIVKPLEAGVTQPRSTQETALARVQ
jgi:signal-transduction protein with cAMP-binding, CBS, and nucleotidyltransferase domain